MTDAIFLSAGVPDPKRGPQYAKTADSVAITAAVSALVHVTLGRRLLVWGGQPAITPMIWVVADGLQVDYGSWVKLYQSKHFQDEYPDDNQRFQNVTYTEEVGADRERSLLLMRERMFSEFSFTAAVFIGGMGGIVQEYTLLRQLQPKAAMIPVTSTGGGTLEVAQHIGKVADDLAQDLDYVALFHRHLDVSVRERRFQTPKDQPAKVVDRMWERQKPNPNSP